jgi:hypothetical protein
MFNTKKIFAEFSVFFHVNITGTCSSSSLYSDVQTSYNFLSCISPLIMLNRQKKGIKILFVQDVFTVMSSRSTRAAAAKATQLNRHIADQDDLMSQNEDTNDGIADYEIDWDTAPQPPPLVKKPASIEEPYIPGSTVPAGKKVKSANLARVDQQIRILRAQREKSTDPNFVSRYKSIKSAYQRDKAAYIKFKNKYLEAKDKLLASVRKYQKVQAEARANGMLSALKSFSTGQPVVIVDIESDSDSR